ncbi:unnamed protein product [Clonostachys rhizophaga]|uniref:aldehyde dehydrogenase (NAD(+)) n=1 Tax=Clonostachys rhizophaga TaxID=160324 RepID=A0A9N9V0H1_9HYPO|nr:unnamed protein product [Clonostachys rhizophaga]
MSLITLTGAGGRQIQVNTGLFVNNEFIAAEGNEVLEVENPYNGKMLASCSAATKRDVDAAVASAETAFYKSWKGIRPSRGSLLNKLADLIERDADDLASLEALEAGILFSDSKALHITQATETLRYFAGWTDKITGQSLNIPQGYAYTTRVPIGICAAIDDYYLEIGSCYCCGQCAYYQDTRVDAIVRPKASQLDQEAGFPLVKLAFTGSSPVGRQILRAAADSNLKKVTLELGGKSPSIVFSDADLDNAVFWTSIGITANNGQVCAAGSRLYIEESIFDKFVSAFAAKLNQTSYGDPLLPETTKGPVISHGQKEKINRYIEQAKQTGLKQIEGNSIQQSPTGHFVANTAFLNVPGDAQIMKEEIFGPVASISTFKTEEEVIEKANDNEHGLSSAVFTKDVDKAYRVGTALEAGQVTINYWGGINANAPFGGIKESGFGRDMGEEALDGWLVSRTLKYSIPWSKL